MYSFLDHIGRLFASGEAHSPLFRENNSFPSASSLAALFSGCDDFSSRILFLGGDSSRPGTLCWLEGMVSSSEIADSVLRPLTADTRLAKAGSDSELAAQIEGGAVWCTAIDRCGSLSDCESALTHGRCVLLLPSLALSFEARTQQSRSISEPTADKAVLGARDSFTETFRTNTSLLRRRLATHELKLTELTVGRQSCTKVGVLYLYDIARRSTVDSILSLLRSIDIDGVTSLGDIEAYLTARPRGVFPQFLCTERPDRMARALLGGCVGILIDGIPFALCAPCTLPELMRCEEDRALHAVTASTLTALRWIALLISLLLPALYAAVAMYHCEMLPYKLLQSVIDAKQSVPFSTGAELLGMLVCFAFLQEAGLRLPEAAGTAVGVIGTLIVGQSAVDAHVVSPIAVIVIALSGIAGYTQPNQHLGSAIRIWRFVLLILAIALGAFGIAAGLTVLFWRLCSTESFGVSYLYPLTDSEGLPFLRTMTRTPLIMQKDRPADIAGSNRRRQK